MGGGCSKQQLELAEGIKELARLRLSHQASAQRLCTAAELDSNPTCLQHDQLATALDWLLAAQINREAAGALMIALDQWDTSSSSSTREFLARLQAIRGQDPTAAGN